MPFTVARGARFHVVEPSRGGTGGPVVMLHGLFTGSVASWYLTSAPALSARHRVRLIDWRGHGLSERTRSGYGATALARDLDALTADLPPFSIVGHSYGCVAALRFLQARPGRVRRIAMVEPPLAGAADQLRMLPRDGTRAARRARELLERTTLPDDLAAEPPVTDANLTALSEVPAMVVTGAASPFAGAADRVRRVCPGVRRHVLDGGHDVHVTRAPDVTALLTAFLQPPIPAVTMQSSPKRSHDHAGEGAGLSREAADG